MLVGSDTSNGTSSDTSNDTSSDTSNGTSSDTSSATSAPSPRAAAVQRLVGRAARVAVAAVVLLGALQEFQHARRHLSRAASSWWDDFDQRDRRRAFGAGIGALLRLLTPGRP